MKKIISILIILLITSSILMAGNTLKDINTLTIYISNREFKGERFLQGNLLYCNLDELKDFLGITYQLTDKECLILSNGIEYKTNILIKGKKVYIPITHFTQTIGYRVKYDENILDITRPYQGKQNNQYSNHYNSSSSSSETGTQSQINEALITSTTQTNSNLEKPERIRLSAIIVETKEETDEIIKELKAGRDFAEIAREKSLCPSSIYGGDLGYFEKGKNVPEGYEVLFDLKVGEIKILTPSKKEYYWFIMKRTDTRGPVPWMPPESQPTQ